MQHRKSTGFGQHRVKGRPIFGLGSAWGVVLNHQIQFKLLEDVVSSDKSEFTVEPTQRIVMVSYDTNIEIQKFERPVRVNREACTQPCQLQRLNYKKKDCLSKLFDK